jgi:tRNA pseudouridine13 synthase
LKSLGSPDLSNKDDVDTSSSIRVEQEAVMGTVQSGVGLVANTETELKDGLTEPSELALPPQPTPDEPWPEHFSASLAPFLNEEQISQVKEMYLEGRELPRVSDSGWAGRNAQLANKERSTEAAKLTDTVEDNRNERGGRTRGSPQGGKIDGRKVISEVRSVQIMS